MYKIPPGGLLAAQSNAACTVQVGGLRDSFLGQIVHHINSTICVCKYNSGIDNSGIAIAFVFSHNHFD